MCSTDYLKKVRSQTEISNVIPPKKKEFANPAKQLEPVSREQRISIDENREISEKTGSKQKLRLGLLGTLK